MSGRSAAPPTGLFTVGTVTGQVKVAGPLAAGTYTIPVTVADISTTYTQTVPIVVAQGTVLPASEMSAAFSTSLDNSMTNGVVGTVTVAGMTPAQWLISVLNDEVQDDPALLGPALPIQQPYGTNCPRYTIASSGAQTAEVSFSYLSAQTDTLVITAINSAGTTVCTAEFPLAIAAKVGPTVKVGPGAGYDFPTWNAAMDAYWTDPAKYAGMTCVLYPQDYSNDFNRAQIGHGSNQQWPPGPMTLQGVSPSSRTLLDFKGKCPGGAAQGGIMKNVFDLTLANLEICNVSNMNQGEGNAGGIYMVNQTFGNTTIRDCYVHDCDNGILDGSIGNHVVLENVVVAMCGNGAGGLTHNIYIGGVSSVTATNVLSFGTAQVHAFKSRAKRTTITNCVLIDGENGCPGGSSNLDLPDGGQVAVSGTTFMKGPNPNNDGNMVQFCTEPTNGGPNQLWPVNTLAISGCTFLNTCPPGALTSSVTAVNLFGMPGGGPCVSPTTGAVATVSVGSSRFYNLPKASWFQAASGSTVADGGGNAALTTWPGAPATDPSTGAPLVNPPGPSYANPDVPSYQGLMVNPLATQLVLPAGAAKGTAVTTATGYDQMGKPLSGASYSLTNTSGGLFAINGATGAITVAGTIGNQLYFITVACSGTDSSGAKQSYSKNLFVVGGTGAVAAS